MSAVFEIRLDYGGSDTSPGSDVEVSGSGNLRFRTDDNNTQDATNPVPIVAGQTKRSYYRHIFLHCTTAPNTKVDNLKFYTDGTVFDTGVVVKVGDQFPTHNSGSDAGYDLATGTPGDTGDIMTTHGDISSSTDASTFTSGSPLSGPSISEGSSQIDAISEASNYLILQAEVDGDTASPGTKSPETFYIQYDEI